MKEQLAQFLKEFSQHRTEEQLAAYQEISSYFKEILKSKGEEMEKTLIYIKDVFNSEFGHKI